MNKLSQFQQLEKDLFEKLRCYQKEGISQILENLKEGKKVLRQNFTGTGKSVEQNYLAIRHLAESENNVYLFLIHKDELIENASRYFGENKIYVNYLQTSKKCLWNTRIYLGSIGSMQGKRLETFQRFVKCKKLLIVLDETHHASAKTWRKILDAFPDAQKVGFSATPDRLDGQGFEELFDALIQGKEYKWYVENKFLAPYKAIVPKQLASFANISITRGDYNVDEQAEALANNEILGDVINTWENYALGQKTIIFCPMIYISKLVVEEFNKYSQRVFKKQIAEHLDGQTNKTYRKESLQRFRLPKEHPESLMILSNVDLFSEGVDVPDCHCTYWLRKTKSAILFDQGNGRSNRYKEGKIQYIIDPVGNFLEHGMPDRPRIYSLKGRKKQEQEDKYKLTCTNCQNLLSEDYRLIHEKTPWLTCNACGTDTFIPQLSSRERASAFKLHCQACNKLLFRDYRKFKEKQAQCSCGAFTEVPQLEIFIHDTEFVEISGDMIEAINYKALFKKLDKLSDKKFLDKLLGYPEISLDFLNRACDYRNLPRSHAFATWSKFVSGR